MNTRRGKHSKSRRIALGGVLSGLALVLMLGGGYIPIGTFAAPIFASICLMPVCMELGPKWALVSYAAVSLLSFLIVPDQELVLFFVLLLGYYPIVQPYINRLRSKLLRWVVKLLIFNVAVVILYAILLLLLASPALLAEFSGYGIWFITGLLLAGNVIFILYDVLLDKVRIIYTHQIRRHLFR